MVGAWNPDPELIGDEIPEETKAVWLVVESLMLENGKLPIPVAEDVELPIGYDAELEPGLLEIEDDAPLEALDEALVVKGPTVLVEGMLELDGVAEYSVVEFVNGYGAGVEFTENEAPPETFEERPAVNGPTVLVVEDTLEFGGGAEDSVEFVVEYGTELEVVGFEGLAVRGPTLGVVEGINESVEFVDGYGTGLETSEEDCPVLKGPVLGVAEGPSEVVGAGAEVGKLLVVDVNDARQSHPELAAEGEPKQLSKNDGMSVG